MEKNCKKTCNVCSGTVTTTKGECGVENRPVTRISGGSETAPNQYPWMVRLPMGCGGSLISDRHILTSKHCLEVDDEDWRGSMVKYSVHNQNDPNDYEEVAIKDYVFDTKNDDIAIIILETAVDLSDETVGTVCLPESADEDYTGKSATAMGWGFNPEEEGPSETLHQVELTVDSEDGFQLFTKTVVVNGVPLDVCRGDSGGPLVYKKGSTWTVIGTVSSGDPCDSDNPNDHENGIWNRVAEHLEWITSVIAN